MCCGAWSHNPGSWPGPKSRVGCSTNWAIQVSLIVLFFLFYFSSWSMDTHRLINCVTATLSPWLRFTWLHEGRQHNHESPNSTSTCFLKFQSQGAWVAQLVNHSTSAQVMISLTACEFEHCIGLCGDSSEPRACFRFCVSLFLCPSLIHALCLSFPQK